jgi:hypothetical protein
MLCLVEGLSRWALLRLCRVEYGIAIARERVGVVRSGGEH